MMGHSCVSTKIPLVSYIKIVIDDVNIFFVENNNANLHKNNDTFPIFVDDYSFQDPL
jgi:hypothetical protein